MSGTKSSSRLTTQKRNGKTRYATRLGTLDKGRQITSSKEANPSKACNCLVKSDGPKTSKINQTSKQLVKKPPMKCIPKDTKKKITTTTNHREKVVIVSKRSSSVSVVKSCKLRKSVSVRKVSYSTSVVLSSEEDEDDEEETDSEEDDSEEEEEKKQCSKRNKTVTRQTTSKTKSSVRETKKTNPKAKKKDKALKLLCNKLSSGRSKSPSRELRPRFPYSNMLQEWPTARTHRMASLNALAKVHVLYENEGRVVGENMNEADETTLIDFLNENSDSDEDSKRDIKPIISNLKKQEKAKAVDDKPKNVKKEKVPTPKPKIVRRGKKRKLPDVEIIDTRVCKRMASLNAQAILAASYRFEPKAKNDKENENFYSSSDTETEEVDLSIVKIEKEDNGAINLPKSIAIQGNPTTEDGKSSPLDQFAKNSEPQSSSSKKLIKLDRKNKQSLASESKITIVENQTSAATISNNSCTVTSAEATTQMGMTEYTEVTKVKINTHKDNAIKEESKSERKIKHVSSKEDVAITQMYRYQSETSSESYCVQMQTTYKPNSKSLSSEANLPSTSDMFSHRNNSLSNPSSYYGHTSMLPSQAYPSMGPGSSSGIDQRLPRHYGASAFSVPHYKHSQHMQFPPSNEYGYYQPAGPLIQPGQDQVIHKPVPYHPQPNPHQTPQRPQPTSHHEGFQTFEPRQAQQNKPTSSLSQSSSEQKSSAPKSDSLSQPSSSRSPQGDARSRNSSCTSFQQPPKHVRSPVMPTLYSSQTHFRSYQTQKRVPSTFSSYSHTPEKKDQSLKHDSKKERLKLVGYNQNAHPESFSKSSDAAYSQSTKETHHQHLPSTSYSAGYFKNTSDTTNLKQRIWDFKHSHGSTSNYASSSSVCNSEAAANMCSPGPSSFYSRGPSANTYHYDSSAKISRNTPSTFLPYRSSSSQSYRKDAHRSSIQEVEYTRASPPVITIDEDNPRDTKTFIQLEVPKNSHKEKIIVVDVEDDDLDINPETTNVQSPIFDKTQNSLVKKNFIPEQINSSHMVIDRPQDSHGKKNYFY